MNPTQATTREERPATTPAAPSRAPYAKPALKRMGLLRQLTRFSFS